MSHLRAPAARTDRRDGGRHGRPVARPAPALPETHIRPQLMRLAVLPPVAVALSASAAVLFSVRSTGAHPGPTLWAVLAGAVAVTVAGVVTAAVAADRAARQVADRIGALRRSAARGEADLHDLVEALRQGENPPHRAARRGPPEDADDFELLAADLARAHDGAVSAVVQAAQLSSQAGSEQKLEVFVNLARRLQSLVHREISILDDLENEIEDPDLLKGLFHVDHLATRIRRHAENLAVLGGAVSRRQWSNPVDMTEVLRSAIAEVEQYSRVKLVPPVDGELRGHAVADVIHLLAELVENATVFSAPHTQVLLRANLVTSGLAVEVEDRGLGMPVGEQSRMNALLADPDQVNVASLLADGRIGLYVVSQLARRHGIQVRLQGNIYGGVQAVLVVPQALLGTAPGAPTARTGAVPPPAPAAGGQLAVPAPHTPPGARPEAATPAQAGSQAVPAGGRHGSADGAPGRATAATDGAGAVAADGDRANGPGAAPADDRSAAPSAHARPPAAGRRRHAHRTPGRGDPARNGAVPDGAPRNGIAWNGATPSEAVRNGVGQDGSVENGAARPATVHHERGPLADAQGGSGRTGTGSTAGARAGDAPAPLPVRGARERRATPADAVPGVSPGDRATVESHAGLAPTPRAGAVRGTMGKPQLPRRRAQEHIAPQLRGGPAPRPDADAVVQGHDPGLMAAFQRGIGLAEAQQHLERTEFEEPAHAGPAWDEARGEAAGHADAAPWEPTAPRALRPAPAPGPGTEPAPPGGPSPSAPELPRRSPSSDPAGSRPGRRTPAPPPSALDMLHLAPAPAAADTGHRPHLRALPPSVQDGGEPAPPGDGPSGAPPPAPAQPPIPHPRAHAPAPVSEDSGRSDGSAPAG